MSKKEKNPRETRGGRAKHFASLLGMLAFFSFSSCVSENSTSATALAPVVLNGVSVITYDLTNTSLKVNGKFNLAGTSDLNLIHIHSDSACNTAAIGNGIESDFETTGILVTVPSTVHTSLYVSTNTSTECYFLIEYAPSHVAPAPPTFTSSAPASPSRTSTSPVLFGAVSPVTLTVNFFSDPVCSTLIGSGPALSFSTSGIIASVLANQANPIYVQGVEPFGNASTCTLLTTYTHSTNGPSPPLFSALSPPSPNRTSLTPLVTGQVSGTTTTVSIFSDAACGSLLASGPSADFTSTGIQVTVPSNVATTLYAVAYDNLNQPSICTYLSTYVHDITPPAAPAFASLTPASPTRITIYPAITGTASADTAVIKLYNSAACTTRIGMGTKVEFEGVGITTSTRPNDTTLIYARAEDLAGNASACTSLATFTHDTLPPDPPVFSSTLPISPNNQSVTPYIFGNASIDSVSVSMFSDDHCLTPIGSDTADHFTTTGVHITTPSPVGIGTVATPVYAVSYDEVGNPSSCTYMLDYKYSNAPAPAPTFFQSLPVSPSRVSTTPYIRGGVAATIVKIDLYKDAACTLALASGSKPVYSTSGIQITVPANSTTNVYGISTDVYGNSSGCTSLTTYIHENHVPLDPTFSSSVPVSPNNTSGTPFIIGSAPSNPLSQLTVSSIGIYDSPACVNRLAFSTAATFATTGIQLTLPQDVSNALYARADDAAGNTSGCAFLMDYVYSTLKPGRPVYGSTTPNTPSYTQNTVIKGNYAASPDFLAMASVSIYSDPACTVSLATAAPALFTSTGIPITVTQNATTTVYGKTVNIVGNESACSLLVNYFHNDLGPANLATFVNPNGSVFVSWNPDLTASPAPTYNLKRSTTPGGPYTVILPQSSSTSFTDISVTKNTTYYYVVSSSNNTGHSFNSPEVSATVSVSTGVNPASLVATPGETAINLTWSGFPSSLFYKVYRGTTAGGPYTQLVSNLFSQNYIDMTVTNGVPYYYVVSATNPAGDSIQSNEASSAAQAAPPAPTNLNLVMVRSSTACAGGHGVTLSWSAPSYYTNFTVYRGGNPGATFPITVTAGTSYVDCGATGNGGINDNYYSVSANWGTLTSVKSNEVACANNPEPILTLSPGNTTIELDWTAPTNALNYIVKRSLTPNGPYATLNGSVAGTHYSDSAVSAGVPYFYTVTAKYAGALEAFPSVERSGIIGPNPSAPTNLVLTQLGNFPQLDWTPPQNYNGFNIYTGPSAAGPWTYLANSTTNSFTDGSGNFGKIYYSVTALWGTYETGNSNSVWFRYGYPTTFTATATATQVNLSWSAVAGATNYKVMRSLVSQGPYTVLSAANAATTYADTAVTLNTGYFYVVSANFADGTSGQLSVEASAMPGAGKIPSGLTILATTTGSVTLDWSKVNGATGYRVYKSRNVIGGPYTLDGSTVTPTNKNVTGLTSASTYYFKVTSMTGASESGQSSIVSALTYSPPGTPTTIAANNQVTLQWAPATGATSYSVLRSTNGVNFSTIASGITATNYDDVTALNGGLYFYKMAGFFPGVTLYSLVSTGTTPGIIPLVPNGVRVTANATGTDVTLDWPVVAGATTYNIYVAATSGGPYGGAAMSTASSAGNVLTGLTAGTTYYIVVSALNGTNESGMSTEISVIPGLPPAAPIVTVGTGAQLNISWTAVPGAATYELQRSNDLVTFTTVVASTASLSFVDNGITSGQSYVYQFIPKGAGGIAMSPSLLSTKITPVITPLVPLALTAFAPNLTSVQLDWIAMPNVVTYNIYRGSAVGGPYAFLASVVNPTHTYIDSAVSGGNTYSYVVTSINTHGVESGYSNESSVILSSKPTGLVATLGPNDVNLAWNAVGGAASYIVKRSLVTGGPYGILASGLGSPAFVDSNIVNGKDYFYVVEAVFAGGTISPQSAEASVTGSETINLQVPIELTDQSLASKTSVVSFESTQTSLDTADYDGTVTYELEAIVKNTDGSARAVNLINSASAVVGTLTVPATTTNPLRMRAVFTPTAGKNIYRLRLAASTAAGSLQVLSARILVTQVAATRTRIYIPLLSSGAAPQSGDGASPIETTQLGTYGNLNSGSLYRRDPSAYSELEDFNPWEFEAVVATGGGATGTVGLYNTTQSALVQETETEFTNTNPTLVNSPFDEGVANFTTINDLEDFSVSMTCKYGCAAAQNSVLYKAGLWVRLTHLTKAEIPFRIALGNTSAGATLDTERTRMTLAKFSNPVVNFQSVLTPPASGSATMSLKTVGTLDTLLTGASTVTGSTLAYPSGGKTWNRSGAITLTTDDRFVPSFTATGGSASVNDATLIIQTSN